MYLHNIPSSYGRIVPKPELARVRELSYDDNVSVHDQIENLRVKISLKERYNKVLKDEMEESRQGATTIIHDLITETKLLRTQFYDALDLERTTVQKALRTHRQFQLAMRKNMANVAITWLDDKLFDMAKRLNCILHRLCHKRKRLENVEKSVENLEKFPRPGSLPWEIDATEAFQKLEYDIENVKVKLETASILHSKYYEIKFILREERGKYAPVLRALDNQLHNQRKELKQLQKMLSDAAVFQNDATKKLVITEQEAADNRRRRKKQMIKIKKAVQRILDYTQNSAGGGSALKRMSLTGDSRLDGENKSFTDAEQLRGKKLEVERFQDRTRRIVEAMKVPDLTHIPLRFQTVIDLGRRFDIEQKTKENLRNMLLRQQNMLNLLLCHFLYTGQKEELEFSDTKRELETTLEGIHGKIEHCRHTMRTYGELVVDVRLAMLAIMQRFEESASKRRRFCNADLRTQIKIVNVKVNTLVNTVEDLTKQIPEDDDDTKQYQLYMRPTAVPPRLIRVGTPVKDEESDEEEYQDLKVPGRVEIKAKSQKFLNNAKLKLGIR